MMETKSYFKLGEWVVIVSLAVASALINSYLPIKSITQHLGVPGPAAGMALFGGVIFVLWVSLAHQVTKRKYSSIVTALLIASLCLFIRPWYGVVEPAWFSVYAIAALLGMGVIIEQTGSRSSWLAILGGGLGNLACLAITWLAIGFHTGTWIPAPSAPFLALGSILSGAIGAGLAGGIAHVIRARP